VEYDKEKFAGPPRSVSKEDMEPLFADWCNYELLNTDSLPEESKRFGLDVMFASNYFLTPKQ